MSQAQQLHAIAGLHDVFERHGIEYWLFGGFAVDFHAGRLTRPHADIDLAIWLSDYARVADLLDAAGWQHSPEDTEEGSTAYERGGVRVELAFLARDEGQIVYTPLPQGRASWAEGAFQADVAELSGVRARVISLSALKEEKSGSRDDPVAAAKDGADLATLSRL